MLVLKYKNEADSRCFLDLYITAVAFVSAPMEPAWAVERTKICFKYVGNHLRQIYK